MTNNEDYELYDDPEYDPDEGYPWGPFMTNEIGVYYPLHGEMFDFQLYEKMLDSKEIYRHYGEAFDTHSGNEFISQQQYKDWLDKNQQEALEKYFKKVLKVIDDLQENIEEIKELYGDDSYTDNVIRDLKSRAYDDLEELLVLLAV